MSENDWSSEKYESYRKLLQSVPNELFWGGIINDLKNPFTVIFTMIELIKIDVEDDIPKINEVLESLRMMKTTSQNLVSVISAIEDHIMDKYKSNADNIT